MPTKALCNSEEESDLRRGPWTIEEDNLLINYISQHGEGRWNLSARCAGLKRTGKSCRLRWLNYLKPDVKRGNLTPQEQLLILELHSKLGNRWSKIAQHLPGRTDNEIKNYWRTRVQKQARQLRIDSDSESFLHAIRCFWTPNTLQNVEQVGPSHRPTFPFSSTLDSTISPPSISNHTPPFNTAQGINHAEDNSGVLSSHQLESSQFHQISEHPASPCAYGNIFYNHPSLSGNLPMLDNSSYDMEDYDPAAMSAIGNGGFFPSDCHMEEGDWASGEMEDTTWNMGELWQFGGVE